MPENLVPIGRLVTSGPDVAERHYPDADLGSTWFGTKPAGATPTRTTAPDGERDAKPETTRGEARTDTAQGEAGTGTAPGGENARGVKALLEDAESRQATSTDAATKAPARSGGRHAQPGTEPGDGVVISLDITGLFHGYGVTAEQALIVPRSTQEEQPEDQHEDRHKDRVDSADGRTPQAASQAPQAAPADETIPPHAAHAAPEQALSGDQDQAQPAHDRHQAPAQADRPHHRDHQSQVTALVSGPEPVQSAPPSPTTQPLSAEDLQAIRWRLDGGTLREVVDDREALQELGVRLDEPLAEEEDNVARAGLLCIRAEVYRLLGELGMAAAASRLALAHAESTGDRHAIVIAQAELAHVLRLRGDFGEADRLFEEAASSESPEELRSVVHENAGRCCFDQGRLMEALDHFARAIRLGHPEDMDLVERIGVSLEAVYIHVLRDGWGPYPRLRAEIVGKRRPQS